MKRRGVTALLLFLLPSPFVHAATLAEEVGAFLDVVAVAGREGPAAGLHRRPAGRAPRHPGRARRRRAHRRLGGAAAASSPARWASRDSSSAASRRTAILRVVPAGGAARRAVDAVVRGADGGDRRRSGVAGRRGGAPLGPSPAGGARAARDAVLGGGPLHRRRRRERGRGGGDGDPADGSRGPDPPPLAAGRRAGRPLPPPRRREPAPPSRTRPGATRRRAADRHRRLRLDGRPTASSRAGLQHVVREQGPVSGGASCSTPASAGRPPRANPRSASRCPLPARVRSAPASCPPRWRGSTAAPHLERGGGPGDWGAARVGYLGIPARYPGTPVETISLRDVRGARGRPAGGARGGTGRGGRRSTAPSPPAIVEAHEMATRRRPGCWPR